MFFKNLTYIALALLVAACSPSRNETAEEPVLKDLFKGKFLIGTAMTADQVTGVDSLGQQIAARHFNSIVAENAMKSEKINPEKGVYYWAGADSLVDFGERNGISVVGHCLVWHSQLAEWFPLDDNGNRVCADTLKQRMKEYITTVMTRYKGRVQGWDVVNEAILDDGSYRPSPFYDILGEEFIPLAFEYAMEADPTAELYINDFGMDKPARRDKYVEIVNDLKLRGLRIDAVGMQGHMGMDYPEYDDFENAIKAFASTGCNVMVTEWDMSALPTIHESANISEQLSYSAATDPYRNGLPEDVEAEWSERMTRILDILVRNSDVVSRVNVWGINDATSWKNDFPIPGRTDYPLLFDREYRMKPFLRAYKPDKQ